MLGLADPPPSSAVRLVPADPPSTSSATSATSAPSAASATSAPAAASGPSPLSTASGPSPLSTASAPAARGEPAWVARLEGVSHAYGGPAAGGAALDGLHLEVREGEFVCVVGPSGGGKSTLLGVLAGLLRPTAGRALFRGAPLEGPGPERTLVPQSGALFPWLTARGNVEFPLRTRGAPARERRARALALLDRVGLAAFADRYPHELSGGMRQRAALARALAAEPRLLLLDEPFSALDLETRARARAELVRAWAEAGYAAVLVTHDVPEAVVLADRVVCVAGGRVAGTFDVDLPRPRDPADPAFAALVGRLERLVGQSAARHPPETPADAREESAFARPAPHALGGPL
ncbi:MAG TPA: ABC transporter ATP-binding protein [Polyangiaceae bacterium]|nr:ABC transporter ATP-binding protein [Polyangiaceae bacterium]